MLIKSTPLLLAAHPIARPHSRGCPGLERSEVQGH